MKKRIHLRFEFAGEHKVWQVYTCCNDKDKWQQVFADTLKPNCWKIMLAFQEVGYVIEDEE